jgi:hypothetical protein
VQSVFDQYCLPNRRSSVVSCQTSSAFSHDQSDPQSVDHPLFPRAWSLGQWAPARSAADLKCWGWSAEYVQASARCAHIRRELWDGGPFSSGAGGVCNVLWSYQTFKTCSSSIFGLLPALYRRHFVSLACSSRPSWERTKLILLINILFRRWKCPGIESRIKRLKMTSRIS